MTGGERRVMLLLTTPGVRGSSVAFVKIARGLAERGHAVELVAGHGEVAEALQGAGCPVHLVPTGDTGRREVGAVRRLLSRQRTEVVIADAPRDVRIARYASLGRRRAILWRHNLHSRALATDILQRWLFGGVQRVLHVSAHSARVLAERSPWLHRPATVIANGFDLASLSPDPVRGMEFRAAHGIAAEVPFVFTPTSPSPEKALDVAEAAMRHLAGARAVSWAHLGDGSVRGDHLGVHPLGRLSHAALLDGLRAADVVLLPSPSELFGNVTAEAMALGRPVVAASAGANPEIVGDAGILVAANDPAAMGDAVALLLDDPAFAARLGEAARARIATHFTLEVMVDGYDRVVRDAR